MKSNTPLLKTLLVAAATLSFCATPAWATTTDTENKTITFTNEDTGAISGIWGEDYSGYTVIFGNVTSSGFPSGTNTCYANIVINATGDSTNNNGLTLTNGYSDGLYTFSGSISGSGNWTFNNSSVSQRYVFLGDMSGYSGNINYSTERANDEHPSYFHFGNGGQAATDTNVSGTGSITQHGNITFNYSDYATTGSTAIAIGNSSLKAETIEFTGSVNYTVSSTTVTGYDSSATLTISNTGTTTGTTTFTGTVSGFGSITVASGATLAVASGGSLDLTSTTVTLASTISNSGSITVDSSTSFVIDGMEMGTYSDGKNYYIVIDGSSGSGSITDGNTLSSSNFSGGGVNSSWNVYTDGLNSGYLVIYGEATQDLTWAGTDGNNTWNTTSENWSGGSTFKSYDNVTFNGTGSSTVVLGEAITAGTIDIKGSTGYTISNGTGSSLSASSLTVETAQGVTTTITVSTLTIDGAISIKPVNTDSSNTHRVLVIGDGSNATTATADSLYMQGSSELQIATGSTLTVGTVTDSGGYDETISGEGTFIVTGTFTHSTTHGFNISIADFQAANFTISNAGSATFSGASSKITETLTLGSSGAKVVYTGEGTHTIGELIANTTGTVSLDYSNLTGSLTIGKVDFGASGTLDITGNASGTGTITTVDFNMSETLSITGGIVNVGTLSDTYTSSAHAATVKIAEGSILSVGSMAFETGSAANICSTISGTADGSAGTLIANSLTIGGGTAGASLEMKDITFISGGITFGGTATNSKFYLFLDNVTWGFTGNVTIAANTGSGDESVIELGDKTSGSLGTTTEATTTVINTNQYSTDSYEFTETGLTIEISAVVAGTGTLEVTGNGSLTLSGTNTYSGGTVIDAGKVIAANNSALGTGTVTIENGGQLSVGDGVTISNNINIILSTENMSTVSPNSVMTAYADSADVYALTGSGTIDSGVTITITVDEAVAKILAEEGEYIFDIYDTQLNGLSENNFDLTALVGYDAYWNGDTGQLILRGLPEPELFSIFFGLGAIGLVATRRRRKAA